MSQYLTKKQQQSSNSLSHLGLLSVPCSLKLTFSWGIGRRNGSYENSQIVSPEIKETFEKYIQLRGNWCRNITPIKLTFRNISRKGPTQGTNVRIPYSYLKSRKKKIKNLMKAIITFKFVIRLGIPQWNFHSRN